MRIGIIALLHESNTFIAQKTTLEHFQQDTLLTGTAVLDRFANTRHELGGFLVLTLYNFILFGQFVVEIFDGPLMLFLGVGGAD